MPRKSRLPYRKAKAMPHVHAHTGYAGQAIEKAKNYEPTRAGARSRSNAPPVAARGRKAVRCGKLLIS